MDAYIPDGDSLIIAGKYIGVAFELQQCKDVPVFWIKVDKVQQMMRGLKHHDAPDWYSRLEEVYIRKNAGGISEKRSTKVIYHHQQLFMLMKLPTSADVGDEVDLMVEHVMEFLKMDHFKTIYLQLLFDSSSKKLYQTVIGSESTFFASLQKIESLISTDLSLNSFLIDEDIISVFQEIYGSRNIDVTSMTVSEKEFFFEGGDFSKFQSSGHSTTFNTGTN